MPEVAAGTVVSKNFLPFARVLARSLRERHPEVRFYALLSDEVQGSFDPGSEEFELILISEV